LAVEQVMATTGAARIGWVCTLVGLLCCRKADKAVVADHHDSVAVTVTSKTQPAEPTLVIDSASPRLIVDSAAKQPSLELHDGAFIVRLPLDMARVLSDSVPEFTLLTRAAFDKGVIGWVDNSGDRVPASLDPADSSALWTRAVSVVVGDFNGDSRRDVAMEGIAGDAFVIFFLLSASDSNARPTLLYFHMPSPGSAQYARQANTDYLTLVPKGKVAGFAEEGDAPILDLRTDAVELAMFEKSSEIFYIEKGAVQIFATSD